MGTRFRPIEIYLFDPIGFLPIAIFHLTPTISGLLQGLNRLERRLPSRSLTSRGCREKYFQENVGRDGLVTIMGYVWPTTEARSS